MSLPTVSVILTAYDQNGHPVAGARVQAKLDRTEIYAGFVVPELCEATTNEAGVAVLELFPNALGSAGSAYQIKAWNPDTGRRFLDVRAVVPNSDCQLEQIIAQDPYPSVDAAQQALLAAQAALAPVTAQAQAAAVAAASAEASAAEAQDSAAASLASQEFAQASQAAAAASQSLAAASAVAAEEQATHAADMSSDAAGHSAAAQAAAATATSQAAVAQQAADEAQESAGAAAAAQAQAASSASIAQEKALEAAEDANIASSAASQAASSAAAAAGHESAALAAASFSQGVAEQVEGATGIAQAAATTATAQASTATIQAGIAADKAAQASVHREQTQLDAAATASDRAQTGLDASAAAASESVATQASQTAQAWAATPENEEINPGTGDYSARHWAAKSAISQGIAGAFASNAVDSAQAAEEALANAVAVVTGGTGSLTAAAGKLPIAGASGVLDETWTNPVPGINAAALHRSPNAITALFVYDTSKDSDGGAWTEKCQHTSWYNEPIFGKWLGAQASEAAARAMAGATTSDYFQRTTDGKFYSLNAGAGITEVFRGNKRDFPRLSAIVAEASSVTIYDLTEPGRPMWMRFTKFAADAVTCFLSHASSPVTSVAAQNGTMAVGQLGQNSYYGHLRVANFAADSMRKWNGYYNTNSISPVGISLRNSTAVSFGVAGDSFGASPGIADGRINAVAIAVLPDAPVDAATGLKVPTIAVATASGVSVISQYGRVSSKSYTPFVCHSVEFDGRFLLVGGVAPDNYWGAWVWDLKDDSVQNYGRYVAGRVSLNNNTNPVNTRKFGKNYAAVQVGSVSVLRHNKSAPGKALLVRAASSFNTGHMVGDIRRAYLADVGAGEVSGPELVANGTFDTDAGWVKSGPGVFWSDGKYTISDVEGSDSSISQRLIGLKAGQVVAIGLNIESNTTYGSAGFRVVLGSGVTSTTPILFSTNSAGLKTAVVPCGVNDPYLVLHVSNENTQVVLESVSVVALVADRSYKASGATIAGTLTKTAVANAAQLVAYSGWSAANYLREPYSADLDFGTGEWTCSVWLSIPTANAAAGTIVSRAHSSGAYITLGIDADNRLTATAFDGTTARTVTTAAAYNRATWFKVRVNYRAGRLSILVNGVELAVTNGAPLLTLNNSNAVLTIGNSYALDAPFPGSLALLKFSATVPTAEQSAWMYEQEKQMFREGAQVCLPDAGPVVDLAYDDATDKWIAVSAANESEWSGLVRTSVTPVPAGSYSKVAAASGVQLLARATTTPGVDVTIPASGLRDELARRAEAAAGINQDVTVFDFDTIGFTAAMTSGSNLVTASSITGTPFIGMVITGAGIPAGTTITGINGATYALSANATVTGSNAVGQAGFDLPVGYTARVVYSAGVQRREGSTKDYTRLFDGFLEQIRFAVTPGSGAWVQIHAVKEAS